MTDQFQHPQVFRLLQAEALDIHRSPTGDVGRVFGGEGLEAVWVAKQQEVIDTAWFSQPTVDLLLMVQGQLRVEFEQAELAPLVLSPGDLLVLPPHTRCRAYRWPRDRQEASIFLAVYPTRRSCRATPPRRKKGRIGGDAPAQRSLASCAEEPDHETGPDGRRNHPLLRWREDPFRQQHVEEILRFCSSKPEYPLTARKKSTGVVSDGDPLHQLRRIGRA